MEVLSRTFSFTTLIDKATTIKQEPAFTPNTLLPIL
jgi:hypothetical protein